MKETIVLFFFVLLSTLGHSQTNWILSNSGIPSDFNTYDFINNGSSEIYAIGANFGGAITPLVYMSNDNGSSWNSHVVSGLTSHDYLYSAGINTGSKYLLNAQDNMGNSAIYSSTDMTNWALSNTGIPNNFNTFDFVVLNSNQIYAVGASFNGVTYVPWVYYSTDGGTSWDALSSVGLSSHNYLYSASIYTGTTVLMNASNDTPTHALYSSTNCVNWTPSNTGLPSNFNTYDFIKIDSDNIWAVGAEFGGATPIPAIYASPDGGVNWTSSSHVGMEPHDYLYSASKAFGNFLFVNASDGAGTYAVYRTANTASIETISSNTNKELLKIVDLMGREVKYETNKVLIYIYSDGSTERFFHIE